jgi:hypothetical protein
MSEFRFFKIKMKVTSVNVRQELHGEDHRLAMDIGLEFNQSNRSLDKLDPLLLQTFFWNNGQGQLDGVEKVSDYPNLRFEYLGMPIKWIEEFTEGQFRIHHGDGASDIVMRDADINNIRITVKEGGTTVYNVRIQCHPDEEDVARVCTVLQSEVTGTIDSDPDEDADEDDEDREPASDARQPDLLEKPAKVTNLRKRKGNEPVPDAQVDQIAGAMAASE